MVKNRLKILRWLGVGFLYFIFGLTWVWTILALWYLSPIPQWVRVLLAGMWFIGVPLVSGRRGPLTKAAALLLGVIFVNTAWVFQEPCYIDTPVPNQAQIPYARISGDEVIVYGVRNSRYDEEGRPFPRWETRKYRLEKLRSLDFMIVPFGPGQIMAHTMLSFGFDDDEYLVISVEAEHVSEKGYNPVAGLFRQFLLRYIIGTERDIIGLRCNVSKDPVRLYPVKAEPNAIRTFFTCMLGRANQLREEPEFYNTITNNCATNIVKHYNLLTDKKIGFDWRILLPAYSDDVALEWGLIEVNVTLNETRSQSTINKCCFPDTGEEKEWSRAIRQCQ